MSGISYDIENEKPISGSITAIGQSIDLTGPNSGTDIIQVTGTWSGTLVVEGSQDGTNFVPLIFVVQSTGLLGTSITANDIYVVSSNGFNQARLRSSAWTSGTATVSVYGSNYPSIVYGAEDKNFGTVGANTIRTASQIGNANGAANFGAGVTSAQTLRVVLPTDQTSIPVAQSGTWTMQPGNTANTTPWLTTDSADGSVAPGVAASKSMLIGGQYNATLPTLTNGQQSAVQVDSSGRILINSASGGVFVSGSISSLGGAVNVFAFPQTYQSYIITVTGTWVGVLVTQKSVDGTTWVNIPSYDPFYGYVYASLLSNMTVTCVGGTGYFRVIAQGYTSGTANIVIEATSALAVVQVVQPSGASLQTVTKIEDSSGNAIYNGQNTMANSLPVAIASNQTAIPVKTQDGAGNALTSQVNGSQRALDVGIDVAGVQVDPRQVRALTASDIVTSNQGAPNTIGNAWPVKPTDGTNSQSYTAANEAKVSVTEPLPAGTNVIGKVSQDTSPWVTSVNNLPATVDTNFGSPTANTIRVAAQLGNGSSAVDFNAGTTGSQTLRTVANQGAPNSLANKWPVRVTDGTNVMPTMDVVARAGFEKITDGTNVATVSTHNDLGVVDGIGSGGLYGNLSFVLANTAYEAKVGASRLTGRKSLTVTPIDSDIYWGYSNAVTVSNGTPIFKSQFTEFALDPNDANVQIWLVCASTSKNARITESQ